jgi:predicted RNase H-like nuclease (RuvC/YqgF family)
MKLFIIKLLTVIAVVLTMYASVVIVHDDASNNAEDIMTLNRKITSLEATNLELESEIDNLKMIIKGFRTALNDREINVDLKVQQAVDNKFKEQTATGNLGTLTGDHAEIDMLYERHLLEEEVE